jgi:hypothetical protein
VSQPWKPASWTKEKHGRSSLWWQGSVVKVSIAAFKQRQVPLLRVLCMQRR